MNRIIAVVICCLLVTPMFASEKAPNLEPIKVNSEKIRSVSVSKIETTISSSMSIGTKREREDGEVYVGKKIVSTQTVSKSNFSGAEVSGESIIEQYKRIMAEELKAAGYPVEAANSLFEEAQKPETEFLIGAIIKKVNVRNIRKPFGKDAIECHFEEVEWQVFDRSKKAVVFKAVTNGYSQKPGLVVSDAATQAFQRSFRNMLANPEFVNALKK